MLDNSLNSCPFMRFRALEPVGNNQVALLFIVLSAVM